MYTPFKMYALLVQVEGNWKMSPTCFQPLFFVTYLNKYLVYSKDMININVVTSSNPPEAVTT